MRFLRHNARRVVVKIGTNTLTAEGKAIHSGRVAALGEQIAALREHNLDVVVVSSGAIGLGMGVLGLRQRPTDLPSLQACAAIGQPLLMGTWRDALAGHGIVPAQVLLTRDDVQGRRRHIAVRDTIERLLQLGTVPIINENDTVSADEIRFGDNDVLSALTASLIRADLLVILTTASGLIDRPGDGRLVPLVEAITPAIRAMAGGTDSPTAVGGMISKIEAADIATQSGCGVFIGSGEDPVVLLHLADGRAEGTFFLPRQLPLDARKRWIAFFGRAAGDISIDAGAERALREKGGSLLAKGVTACSGSFAEAAVVNVRNPAGRIVARGLSAFSSEELRDVIGCTSAEIRARQPGRRRCEVIHRDSMVLMTDD
jgi:glutamate 5-kinase